MVRRLGLIAVLGAVMAAGDAPLVPLDPSCRVHVTDGQFRDAAGRRVVFYGVNLFQSHLMWSRRQDLDEVDAALRAISAQGFNAVRMPMNMAWVMPRPGVFPDSPSYAEVMRSHRLPDTTMGFYDELVRRAGEQGLYVVPEFHELPCDPYRWFVGGEERDRGSGKAGRAISWMGVEDDARPGRYHADPALAREHVPKALGWLAGHWRDSAVIAGIEVPWNEPRGPLTEGAAYTDLCRACARAVKTADPRRLVFMDCVDWGAMVNRILPESVWRLPDEIDALFPHFYPGMHSNSSGEAGTWSTTMANWASWLMGSGRPVMVGEYGVVEMKRAQYWGDNVDDRKRAATYAACLAQWHAMGVQGVFAWAWGGGIGWDEESRELTAGAEVLPKWAAVYREGLPVAAAADVAVVCAPRQRAPYGGRHGLWRLTDALLDAHVTPFATVFDAQVVAQPTVLERFHDVMVLDADLEPDTAERLRDAAARVHWLDANLNGLAETVARIRERRGGAGPGPPGGVIVGLAPGQAVVFERRGRDVVVQLPLAIPGATGSGRLLAEDGRVLFRGPAQDLAQQGAAVPLTAWQCLLLRWQG